jgi:hypothetical protein
MASDWQIFVPYKAAVKHEESQGLITVYVQVFFKAISNE